MDIIRKRFPFLDDALVEECAAEIVDALIPAPTDAPDFVDDYVRRRSPAQTGGRGRDAQTSGTDAALTEDDGMVTFTAEEWAQLYSTFAQLMSVYSSHDEVVEAIQRENEIWRLLAEKENRRRAVAGEAPLAMSQPDTW